MRKFFALAFLLLLASIGAARAQCSSAPTGTTQTLSYLYTNEFQDNGTPGHITPGCYRDMINTLAANANAGVFKVSSGVILDPTGKPFIAKGINVADWAAIQSGGQSTDAGTLITKLFPGINIIRINNQATGGLVITNGNDDPAQFASFVAAMTAAKIVVIFEDHTTNTGSTNNVPTGTTLTTEIAWYGTMSAFYGSNPYVWYGTMNEPNEVSNEALVTSQQVSIYNAVRANSSAPINMQMIGGFNTTQNGGLTSASYTTMTNVYWEPHYYNFQAGGSASYAGNKQAVTAEVANAHLITSADGVMPIIFGEYGNSAGGTTADAGGTQAVLAAQNAGYGAIAWTWWSGTSDLLVSSTRGLTNYGAEVAAWISGNDITNALGTPIYGPFLDYIGPGDLGLTGPGPWGGLRCYSGLTNGPIADVWDSSTGSTTETLLTCSPGGVINQTINPLATTCASACRVKTLYDQSGSGMCSGDCNWTQATNANRPVYTTSAVGGKPCMTFTAASSEALISPAVTQLFTVSQAQPLVISAYGERTTNAFSALFGADASGLQLQWTNSASTMVLNAGSSSASVTASDNAFHAWQALFNSTTSSLLVDTTANTGLNPGSNGLSIGNTTAIGSNANAGNFFGGVVCEAGLWFQNMTTGNQTALQANQAAFY